ncbi:MAG: phage head morphogenesis protein [Clostridia bacterium]|nr:phage head morphogenesis protein [Clostridia bacterium]
MIILQDKDLEGNSSTWKNWMSALTPTTCTDCAKKHGTIFSFYIDERMYVPAHINGQCKIVPMRTKVVGTATIDGALGADAFLIYTKRLPKNYITFSDAKLLGWISTEGNLDVVAPGKMVYGEHLNKERKLPSAPGRKWYEADINYSGGYRGSDRLLFSSDGLIFVSYDHYKTYYEVIR